MPVASKALPEITIEELAAWVTLKTRVYGGLTPQERALWDRIHRRRVALKVKELVCDGSMEVSHAE